MTASPLCFRGRVAHFAVHPAAPVLASLPGRALPFWGFDPGGLTGADLGAYQGDLSSGGAKGQGNRFRWLAACQRPEFGASCRWGRDAG